MPKEKSSKTNISREPNFAWKVVIAILFVLLGLLVITYIIYTNVYSFQLFIYNKTGVGSQPLPRGASTVDSNGNPTACNTGYTLTTDTPPICKLNQGIGAIGLNGELICKKNFILSPDGTSCNYPIGVAGLNPNGTPSSCVRGYILKNDQCVYDLNVKTVDTNGNITCNAGYVLTQSATGSPCVPPFVQTINQDGSLICALGASLINNLCVPPTGTLSLNPDGTAKSCSPGYILSPGANSQGTSMVSGANSQGTTSATICQLPQGVSQVDSLGNILVCAPGYIKNHGNSIGSNATVTCTLPMGVTTLNSLGVPTACNDGYILNTLKTPNECDLIVPPHADTWTCLPYITSDNYIMTQQDATYSVNPQCLSLDGKNCMSFSNLTDCTNSITNIKQNPTGAYTYTYTQASGNTSNGTSTSNVVQPISCHTLGNTTGTTTSDSNPSWCTQALCQDLSDVYGIQYMQNAAPISGNATSEIMNLWNTQSCQTLPSSDYTCDFMKKNLNLSNPVPSITPASIKNAWIKNNCS